MVEIEENDTSAKREREDEANEDRSSGKSTFG